MSAGKAQDDPLVDNDPWLVQNAKGRVRQAEHGAPAKPTLEVFMPPGFANIEHTENGGGIAETVGKMKQKLNELNKMWEKASKSSPKRRSDGMPISQECRALWEQIGQLNRELGQLRGPRPSLTVGARRWATQRASILQKYGCECSDCSLDSSDGEEVSSNVSDTVSQKGFLGGHS